MTDTDRPQWHVAVPVTPGDYLDRVAILMVKSHLVQNEERREQALQQLRQLYQARDASNYVEMFYGLPCDAQRLLEELMVIHLRQWALEDQVRREQVLHDGFQDRYLPADVTARRLVNLNNAIRHSNRERTSCKHALDQLFGQVGEPKEYAHE